MTSIAEMARCRPPFELVEAPTPDSLADPDDVLAQLSAAPARDLVATGTPLDSLAGDRVGRGALLVLRGEAERGKTALALALAAHRLRAGDHVIVHIADRDPLAAVGRLATLLGCEPGELAGEWPRLRMRSGDLARSVDLLTAQAVLVVDSIQTAAHEVRARRDAAPHERAELVLRELRRAAIGGALVAATSERAPSGDDRHTHAAGYAADVLALCDRDAAGRFSLVLVKPSMRGLRWYVLDANGWPIDATAESPAEQVARVALETRPRKPGRRRADNPPARTPGQIEHDVCAYLTAHPDASTRAVQGHVRGRAAVVRQCVRRIRAEGGS